MLDTVFFCNTLSEKEGVAPYYHVLGHDVEIPDKKGPGYRLPTEAEWEYACRAGTTTNYSFGENGLVDQYGWWIRNSNGHSHLVGDRFANGFGLYDMHGNVYEWCLDGFDRDYYKRAPTDDPPGASGTAWQIARGGAWNTDGPYCRSAARFLADRGERASSVGFRVARGTAAIYVTAKQQPQLPVDGAGLVVAAAAKAPAAHPPAALVASVPMTQPVPAASNQPPAPPLAKGSPEEKLSTA